MGSLTIIYKEEHRTTGAALEAIPDNKPKTTATLMHLIIKRPLFYFASQRIYCIFAI